MLVLGTMIAGLARRGVSGWALVLALLLVVRPLAALASLVGTGLSTRERVFVAWFGVRGVATLNYGALAAGSAALATGERSTVFWTAAVAIALSILMHGATATPLSRRLLR